MTIYLRNLKENIIRVNIRLKISNFFPGGLISVIKNKVPENNFILGVCYHTGDSQICISGHPKTNETIIEGAVRELREELSLSLLENIDLCNSVDLNTFFTINLKNTFLNSNFSSNSNPDIRNRAVICVHGEEGEVLKYLAHLKDFTTNEDNITSVWASDKHNILKYLESENKPRFLYPVVR